MSELQRGTTWVIIDPAHRTPNGVFAFAENCHGPVEPGDRVHVRIPEQGLMGGALVTAVDDDIVYLSLSWNTLYHGFAEYYAAQPW